jgi:hypothetical protein
MRLGAQTAPLAPSRANSAETSAPSAEPAPARARRRKVSLIVKWINYRKVMGDNHLLI